MSTSSFSEKTKNSLLETDRMSDERDVRAATQPYQKDFPYDRSAEAQVTRREFCNFLGLTSGALFLGAAGFAAKAALDARVTAQFVTTRIDGAEMLAPNSDVNLHLIQWIQCLPGYR
jgi:hypothetical protein